MNNIWTRLYRQLKEKSTRQNEFARRARQSYKSEMIRYQSSGIFPKSGQDDYPIYCRMCGYMGPMSSTYPFESEKDIYGNPGRSCPNCGSLLQTQYLKYGGHDGNPKYPDLYLDGDVENE